MAIGLHLTSFFTKIFISVRPHYNNEAFILLRNFLKESFLPNFRNKLGCHTMAFQTNKKFEVHITNTKILDLFSVILLPPNYYFSTEMSIIEVIESQDTNCD